MTGSIALAIILGYFGILMLISFLTSRGSTNSSFFTGDRNSPWYVVAFGMIGATLSGITFISVPGSVYTKGMSYMPMVIGFLVGYIVISYVLIPLYYRLNLTSIYSYLKGRFGQYAFKTGASFFLLSRFVGASLRLYLAAEVLDIFLFTPLAIPYSIGIVITVGLIWVYTFKSGIKTIVWTDALQTACILLAVGATIYFIKTDMNASLPELMKTIQSSDMFDFAKGKSNRSWNMFLSFFNGAMIAIVMTGLDQDMMQKSLTCKNVNDAKKNIVWLGVVLIPVNFIFLSLGLLIFENYIGNGLSVSAEGLPFKILAGEEYVGLSADRVYPALANYGYFPTWLSATFLIGLVAAAYSSADSALTSLTTSFCLDILENDEKKTRFFVHIGTSLVLILVVLIFKEMESDSIVWKLFSWAGFTYGPLLGLFSFGMFSKRNVKDQMVPIIAIISVLLSVWIKSELDLGPEVLVINGGLTVLGLLAFSKKEAHSDPNLIDA